MTTLPLQLWGPEGAANWVAAYTLTADVLMALFGVFIAYHAYRGYRRNDSRPMLYISIGFVLVLTVPFVLLVAVRVVPVLPETATVVVIQTIQVLGLAAILYGFRVPS